MATAEELQAITEMIASWADNLTVAVVNGTGSEQEFGVRLSRSLLLSFTFCLALLISIGLIGNSMVIFALIRTKAHNVTTTNTYILHLSTADLLFLVFCVPFQGTLYILNDWPFGDVLCRVAHFCQYCTMYASVWILTVMSVDRYVAIGHPLKSVDLRSPGQAMRVSLGIWLTAALFSAPWLYLYQTDSYLTHSGARVHGCFDNWPNGTYTYRKWMFVMVFNCGFFIPALVIICMALLVAVSIRLAADQPLLAGRSENASAAVAVVSKRRRRVIWLVFALSLIFILCWLPQNVSLVWLNFYGDIRRWLNENYRFFFIAKMIAHMLTYVNSSVNPILYSLASGQFRARLAHALSSRTGSFGRTTVSHRARMTAGVCAANRARPTQNGGHGRASGRHKHGSFQPLLHPSTHSRTDDDVASLDTTTSRRSSSRSTGAVLTPQSYAVVVRNQIHMQALSANVRHVQYPGAHERRRLSGREPADQQTRR